MRRFYLSQLWLLIPGLGLMWVSSYVPLNYLHKQIFWTETEALIIERTIVDNAETELYKLDFTDTMGTLHHIQTDGDNTFTLGKSREHVRIYYDPSNPADFELVNPGGYLIVLFFPFGLLCSYLGWPRNDETNT